MLSLQLSRSVYHHDHDQGGAMGDGLAKIVSNAMVSQPIEPIDARQSPSRWSTMVSQTWFTSEKWG